MCAGLETGSLDDVTQGAGRTASTATDQSPIARVPSPARSRELAARNRPRDLLEPRAPVRPSEPPARALGGVTLLPGPLPPTRSLTESLTPSPDRRLSGFRDSTVAETADLGEASRRARVARARREARRRRLQRSRLVGFRRTDWIVRAVLEGSWPPPAEDD